MSLGGSCITNAMRPWFVGILGCLMRQVCAAEGGAANYSWVVQNMYQTAACDTFAQSFYFPLDTCLCFTESCEMVSKTDANTIAPKFFALTDTSCQGPGKTEPIATSTCWRSSKFEFVGDGPGAVFETFASSTCYPGTSTGVHVYFKLGTCYMKGTSSWQSVCANGKVKTYIYTSENCSTGATLQAENAKGDCWAQRGQGFLLKGGC
eukprot:Skav209164  [mRNA]  locus=scaffold1137:308745:309365:- [translate_table: standard]